MGDYIVLNGRNGLEYYDDKGNVFFIDSEIYYSENYDYAIYVDSIIERYKGLTSQKIQEIINRVIFLCKERGMKPKIFKDNF